MTEREEDSVTVRVLKGLREDLRAGFAGVTVRLDTLNERVDGLNGRVDGLSRRVDGLERATIAGFEGVHRRLEHLDTGLEGIRDIAGERWRDHEDRIRKLETATDL